MRLILASNSPRRKELLKNAHLDFVVISSDYEEKSFSLDPIETAKSFAKGKAESVFNALETKTDAIVLGADTVVFLDDTILGKAKSKSDAVKMLKRLSGKTHTVITGYYIKTVEASYSGCVKTDVTFNDLDDDVINAYVDSGLYEGKAGSYGIQDSFPLVKCYEGSLSNVIGLPVEVVVPILKKLLK